METGQCLCGQVRFEFDGEPADASYCHCSLCRRLTGSAFGAWCEVPDDRFRWSAGEDSVSTYPITERLHSFFCNRCGATVAATHAGWPGLYYILMGTLDSDQIMAPRYHVFTASKAAWYRIHDSLPQYDEWQDAPASLTDSTDQP